MKKLAPAFALAAFALGTHAAADTKIPNSKVSYKVSKDGFTGGNASMVFVDAAEDPSGKTYAAFVCDLGDTYLRIYSKTALGLYSGQAVTLYVRVDNGKPRVGAGTLREDSQRGRLSVLEMNEQSLDALRMFLTAQTKVAVRINRGNLGPLTLTFPTKGLVQAYRAIGMCE